MNRQWYRRGTGPISTLLVAGLIAAGCGIGGSDEDSDGTDSVTGSVEGSITFQTWNLKGSYEEYFTELVSAFEEEYPDATVTWVDQPADGYSEKLSADAAAGTLPDVIDMGPEAAYTLASAGMLLDVSEVDPEAEDDFLPKAWEAMTWAGVDGGTYGYPWYLNTGPSFFNTALMEQAGLDTTNLPTTYDELFEAATTMAANSNREYSMIGRTPTIETMGEYGVELMNEDGTEFTFNNSTGVALLDEYRELYEVGALTEDVLNEQQTGEVDKFKAGELGWLPGSAYNLKDFRENAPSIYESVAIGPKIANSSPNMYIESLVVNAKSENKATALAFAKFATNAENQLGFSQQAAIFPSTVGTLDDPYFTTEDGTDDARVRVEAATQVAEAVVWWPPAFSEVMVDELREQVALAINGDKTSQQALDDAVAFCNEKLQSS